MALFEPSIELGHVKNLWTDSYNGQKAYFVNNTVLVYSCGANLKFYDIETKETTNFQPSNFDLNQGLNNICHLTANSAINKFAFSETQLGPKVYVYDFDKKIKEQSVLIDGADIEYLIIEFSNSEALLTLAAIPNMKIIIWNWKNGSRLTNINLNESLMYPEFVTFSPTNWRHLTVAYKTEINIWKLEQFDSEKFKTNNTRFLLPISDNQVEEQVVGPEFKNEFDYPNNAITNLDEKNAHLIDEILDPRKRHTLKSICWSNIDEILVSTNENYIFKYSLVDSSIKCVFKPKVEPSEDIFELNRNNLINKMLIHKQGLFALCDDGFIRILDGGDLLTINKKKEHQPIEVIKLIDNCSNFISNLSFNTKHSLLATSTNKGVQLVDCEKLLHGALSSNKESLSLKLDFSNEAGNQNDKRLELIINYDAGRIVGISSVNPQTENFLVLKEFGTIQVWNVKKRQIVNRLHLKKECSYLATHPHMPLAVVGTVDGHLIFVDFSNYLYPKTLENISLHSKQVKRLKFNTSGTFLISVGDDCKVYVIDVSLAVNVESYLINLDQRLITDFTKPTNFEPGFYILGYTEFDGEATCLDTFDYIHDDSTKLISTRVAIGLYDNASWEVTKKQINDNPQSVINNSDPKSAAYQQSLHLHNALMPNVQTDSVITRLDYIDSSSTPNYDYINQEFKVQLASKCLLFDINYSIFQEKSKIYASKKLDFKDEIINKNIIHSHYLFSDMILTSKNYFVLFCDRFLAKFVILENETSKKTVNKQSYLDLVEIVGSHEFGYGCVSSTNNRQFMITGGFDGTVSIRKTADPLNYIEIKGPHFSNGGCLMVRFHSDLTNILVAGNDNTVNCLNWSVSNDSVVRALRSGSLEGNVNRPAFASLESHYKNETTGVTWFEYKEKEFYKEQDVQYLPIKKNIIDGLAEIKVQLNQLMDINNGREELAKLKEHEFYLDLEELERLHKEADTEILKIKDKTEFDNLSKLFIREQIKKECWDGMKVKGRGIQAFNSNLLVENYSLKERTQEELKSLERVKMIRRIELMAQKTRSELTVDLMKRDNITELAELDEDEQKDVDNASNSSGQGSNNYISPNLVQLSYKGSIGPLFNGDSSLFYHQFELFTREQKWMQIILIQDALFRIKENFNKEFELVMQRKHQEIAKIKEKNQRLKQIYIDLNEEQQLSEPQFGDAENPELLFDVKDDEIKVEKYLTPEQRKQLEEQLAEEARRRELEKLDNWRERGLMDMMSGVLQIRREDELKKDIPIPPFVKEKPKEEWTPEEHKIYQVYEQKVKELNEEREKLRKQLHAEIGKINEQIQECYVNFDNILLNLHLRKVKTQQAIYQEELKIVRLFNSLVVDTELETYERQLNTKLDNLKEQKKEITQEIQHLKKSLDSFREEFDILTAEDKSQEKAFLREFSDVPPGVRDQLLKLYKKRTNKRVPINKTNLNPTPHNVPELGVDNPFSDRPSTAQQLHFHEMDTQASLAELDNYEHAPSGCDHSVWERFINVRRNKIAMENTLKIKNLNINEMNLYLQKRMEEDDFKKKEIDEYSKNSLAMQELRLKAHHNLQIQLLMKQGQVEINPGAYVHNFENCLLINRKVVESLNKIIQHHGKQKITIMVDSKDFRKGIRQLEWEHHKMKMIIEDYITKQRDITYLKLTREVQEYLNSEDYDAKKQKEIAVLEDTIAYQAKQYEKVYKNKTKKVNEIRNFSIKVANNNDHLDDNLKDTNVSLYDRKHINEEMTGKTIETIRQEKFQQIIQRRKLVDLAKAQAQEVAFLRSEVERLRMKTFPALVQIEF
ncbi:unnamed protein product [Brachionus calyciflorus]|uniref:Cilia- and flagella-associated protein 43 n=1 Tax=Brachionus calyciflorus TaxID=104777 RepID=A0A813NXD3_9BILA|nr:unnamed protein product [Brachionus calyciflorus]